MSKNFHLLPFISLIFSPFCFTAMSNFNLLAFIFTLSLYISLSSLKANGNNEEVSSTIFAAVEQLSQGGETGVGDDWKPTQPLDGVPALQAFL